MKRCITGLRGVGNGILTGICIREWECVSRPVLGLGKVQETFKKIWDGNETRMTCPKPTPFAKIGLKLRTSCQTKL